MAGGLVVKQLCSAQRGGMPLYYLPLSHLPGGNLRFCLNASSEIEPCRGGVSSMPCSSTIHSLQMAVLGPSIRRPTSFSCLPHQWQYSSCISPPPAFIRRRGPDDARNKYANTV